jgi:hypothetical protein
LICSSYVFRMISSASRSALKFAASLVSMTVVEITGLIGSLDDFAPFCLNVVGLIINSGIVVPVSYVNRFYVTLIIMFLKMEISLS